MIRKILLVVLSPVWVPIWLFYRGIFLFFQFWVCFVGYMVGGDWDWEDSDPANINFCPWGD